jgi:hypothetical protein
MIQVRRTMVFFLAYSPPLFIQVTISWSSYLSVACAANTMTLSPLAPGCRFPITKNVCMLLRASNILRMSINHDMHYIH